jgi:hypothetical protein
MCEEVEIVVNSVVVPESIRMNKLPEYFGGKFLICENLIYHYMEKLCSDYQGGYWNFYECGSRFKSVRLRRSLFVFAR